MFKSSCLQLVETLYLTPMTFQQDSNSFFVLLFGMRNSSRLTLYSSYHRAESTISARGLGLLYYVVLFRYHSLGSLYLVWPVWPLLLGLFSLTARKYIF